MPTKPYAVFIVMDPIPSGGWDDYSDSFETQARAEEYIERLPPTYWYQIVDLSLRAVISEGTVQTLIEQQS